MTENGKTEILLALHRIEDRLQEIAKILELSHKETLDMTRKRILSSAVRQAVYELCDGKHSVNAVATSLAKSPQQISNNINLLLSAGLIKEERHGKEKFYRKLR